MRVYIKLGGENGVKSSKYFHIRKSNCQESSVAMLRQFGSLFTFIAPF
jgi:hypothetical protein